MNLQEKNINPQLPIIWIFWTWWEMYWEGWVLTEELLVRVESWDIKARVAVIVSDHESWWMREKSDMFWLPFHLIRNFPKRWENWNFSREDKERIRDIFWLPYYLVDFFPKIWEDWEFSDEDKKSIEKIFLKIVNYHWLDYVFISKMLWYIFWLDVAKTVNIYPWPIKKPYGLKWIQGMKLHRKIWNDYISWEINKTCITMHFVTEEIDESPIIA